MKNYYPYKGMTKLQKESKINQSIYILKNIFSTYKHLLLYYNTIIILYVNEYKKFEVAAKKNLRFKGSKTSLLSVL